MSRRADRWFRIDLDGRAAAHIRGWKDAKEELDRLRKRYGASRVTIEEETP